jgi:peptidoglycan-associated lipoprotein
MVNQSASLARLSMMAAALTMAFVASGCVTDGPSPVQSANVTNAPVGGGINVNPGSEEDFIVNVSRRTFFRQNSAELDGTAKATLDKQAQWLGQHPQWRVKIQGFADDGGSAEAQRALSTRRADAVRNYLVAQGVQADRLKAKGYGRDPSRLTRDCPDIECTSQNRRVITKLLEPGEEA